MVIGVFVFVRGKTSENNLLESAFQLALFILGDKDSAEVSAMAAAARLNVAAVAQDRRYYYVPGTGPKAYGARTKVNLNDLHLLQRLVYDETESYERAHEQSTAISEERLLRHFLKHLVRITLKRNSFYVTLGVSRLLHRYSTPEAVELYSLVLQNPGRVKDNYYWRSRKAQLMEEMKTRFGNQIAVVRGAYGEERFASRDDSPRYAAVINDCLNTLMPWGTACPLPSGTAAAGGSIPALDFKGADPDEEHQVEIARIHAVLHSDCLARLIAGLNLHAPETRLEVPRFFRSPIHDSDEPMKSTGLHPSDMTLPDLNKMRARLNEQEQLLRRAKPERLRLVVDRQERGTLDLTANSQASFTLSEGDEFLELRTPLEEGDVRLALYPIDYARLEQAPDDDQFVLALADGRKLNFVFTPQRDQYGELTGATVTASYQATGWRRWRQSLLLVITPSAPAFSYALTAALLLIGLTGGILLWQLLRADSSTPTVVINKPPATGSSNGGASGTPLPVKVETPVVSPSIEKSLPPKASPPAPRPTVKREPDVDAASAVRSISEVKQIFIPDNSGGAAASALREQLGRQLQATGRWTIASREDADAALNILIKSAGGRQTSSIQLVNASGQIIWPSKGKWRIYSGDARRIAKQLVNDLLKAAR
ncbi:MAG: hypothetical protein ABI977_23385 [Acidobacteriota bacterium]